MQTLRSSIFFVLMIISAVIVAIPGVMTFPLRFERRYAFIRLFARFNIWSLKILCKLDFEIKGKDNIPGNASIILCKHQSTWETFALQLIFPPQIWVLKKSLLKIPFFGWGLAMLEPIAIDRSAKKQAMEQILEQGSERLNNNRWVVIFPEGTRTSPGKAGKYKLGGARLAEHTGKLVVPVAHNAGEFWPKHGFTKKSGTITISILPPIDPKNKTASEILDLAKNAIEQEVNLITLL